MKRIGLFCLLISCIATASAEPEFHLCSGYVQRSATGEQSENGWPVFIQLTERGANSFKEFTEANVGSPVRIVVADREFTRATLWTPIPGGRLHGSFPSEAAATEWQRLLEGGLPPAPCGAEK
ncbi:hypothetical protein MD273_08990 [Marinobacter pelagius]|uniref:SecDF P1 head subdomain-containing protein n=1 Tax=Marinobacter sp. C7 TaxID=2951363 RepID=UPI001EF13CB6|nr:hypothetical protein [Marinobacter sp. C7]MCG7199855.1 hypothetical protein [Marinobacter sp. C7]